MARLAAQAKMGFYPTPIEELDRLMGYFKNIGTKTVLDPCFGDSRVLKAFKALGCSTYGVELNETRFNNREGVDVAINADALMEIVVNKNSFDILFLNPPYDNDLISDNQELFKKRLETRFLEKYLPSLKTNGILVYVVPFKSILNDYHILYRECEEIGLYRFDDEVYKQWIFIGRKAKKRINPKLLELKRDYLKNTEFDICYPLKNSITCDTSDEAPPVKIFSHTIKESDIEKAISNELLKLFKSDIEIPSYKVQPVAEPREGHLSLLTASGLMNGKIGNKKIKGSVYHYTVESQEDEESEEGKRLKIVTTVTPRIKIYSLENDIIQEIL